MYRPEAQLAAEAFGKSLRLLSAGGSTPDDAPHAERGCKGGLAIKPPLGKSPSRLIVAHLMQKGRAKRLSVIDGGPFATAARS